MQINTVAALTGKEMVAAIGAFFLNVLFAWLFWRWCVGVWPALPVISYWQMACGMITFTWIVRRFIPAK